jgi:hypothetical protein
VASGEWRIAIIMCPSMLAIDRDIVPRSRMLEAGTAPSSMKNKSPRDQCRGQWLFSSCLTWLQYARQMTTGVRLWLMDT